MNFAKRSARWLAATACLLAFVLAATQPACAAGAATPATQHDTYDDQEVAEAASKFFSNGAEGLSDVLGKVLREKGKPIAYIRGEEAGGAVGVGLRYGRGELVYKGGETRKVFWQGPSIGIDFGANAVKVFILVYDLPNTRALFQRYPGVEGSLYFVGGFGVNYVERDGVSLAPVRFGVGWRQGISVSYMKFTAKSSVNPF
jgi:hypothetical protein